MTGIGRFRSTAARHVDGGYGTAPGSDSRAGRSKVNRLIDLGFLFRVVAIVEVLYGALGLLTPPHLVYSVTGWTLSPDGQWVTKLLAIALLSQAWVAWLLRDRPNPDVALALAFYQIGSATADWVIWLGLSDQGVFASPTARAGIIVSIPLHYTIGFLLLTAARRNAREKAAHG